MRATPLSVAKKGGTALDGDRVARVAAADKVVAVGAVEGPVAVPVLEVRGLRGVETAVPVQAAPRSVLRAVPVVHVLEVLAAGLIPKMAVAVAREIAERILGVKCFQLRFDFNFCRSLLLPKTLPNRFARADGLTRCLARPGCFWRNRSATWSGLLAAMPRILYTNWKTAQSLLTRPFSSAARSVRYGIVFTARKLSRMSHQRGIILAWRAAGLLARFLGPRVITGIKWRSASFTRNVSAGG